jgi:hypothetical protein
MKSTETTLIIPDLHLRHELAEKIIKHVGADTILFLGDYWDDFGDTPEMIRATSEWFVWSVNQPNRIHLAGNHCMHYAYANREFQCSGYEQWKYFMINDIVSANDWGKMKFYHFLDDKWLLSHAGLHKFHLPEDIAKLHTDRPKFIESIKTYLDEEIIKGFRNQSWIFHAGFGRGGFQRVGGITWCDHNDEMYPVIGLNQIYGHSPQRYGDPSWLNIDSPESNPYFRLNRDFKLKNKDTNDVNKSINLCLDVWQNTHWAVWNGKKMTIGNYKDDL